MNALAGKQDTQASLAPEGIVSPQGPDLALLGRGPWPPSGTLRAPAEGSQALEALLPVARGPAEVGGSGPADGPQGSLLTATLSPQVPVDFQWAPSVDGVGGGRVSSTLKR